mmetsp:Transcript_39523/g.102271  ORF Transcript_39523/g.102271 Transcript_39523/m.102271 type:complete len:257 (+) Transcript_39523:150-920(+)
MPFVLVNPDMSGKVTQSPACRPRTTSPIPNPKRTGEWKSAAAQTFTPSEATTSQYFNDISLSPTLSRMASTTTSCKVCSSYSFFAGASCKTSCCCFGRCCSGSSCITTSSIFSCMSSTTASCKVCSSKCFVAGATWKTSCCCFCCCCSGSSCRQSGVNRLACGGTFFFSLPSPSTLPKPTNLQWRLFPLPSPKTFPKSASLPCLNFTSNPESPENLPLGLSPLHSPETLPWKEPFSSQDETSLGTLLSSPSCSTPT